MALNAKNTKLHHQIQELIRKEGVVVDSETGEILIETFEKQTNNPFQVDTPQSLLWQQQKLRSQIDDARGMRWHLSIIRWCLSIYLKSPKT